MTVPPPPWTTAPAAARRSGSRSSRSAGCSSACADRADPARGGCRGRRARADDRTDRPGRPADARPRHEGARRRLVPGRRPPDAVPARGEPRPDQRPAACRAGRPAVRPRQGLFVIYELPTAGDADRVGKDFAAYLGSGTGAIQYPRDASSCSGASARRWCSSPVAAGVPGPRDGPPRRDDRRDRGARVSPDRQRIVDRGPRADAVALDLEGVGAGEVGVRPDAPAGDPLVRPERPVGGLDRRIDLPAHLLGRGGLDPRRCTGIAGTACVPGASTTASMRPGRVSIATESRIPATRSAFSRSWKHVEAVGQDDDVLLAPVGGGGPALLVVGAEVARHVPAVLGERCLQSPPGRSSSRA